MAKALKTRLELYEEAGFELEPSAVAQDLEGLKQEIGDCKRCKLCSSRQNLVFGVGNPNADLVFVGEAPGRDEDEQGEPFVGRSGKLLTKMIEAMGLKREDIYICNVIKCRPPDNRNPEKDEVETCEPFLKKQLEIIKPKVIVALGRYACQSLLKFEGALSSVRGKWTTYEGIDLMPTFHPAYLLRNQTKKKEAWEDLQQVMKRLGI
ncbi:MAG: uracil-DNA glycosylase [Deltaproteobacteria bacterium]|nr:uracil-DNA glycosylase [Deltaproteobacteria bacterium]